MEIRASKSGVFVEGMAPLSSEVTVGNPLYKLDTSAAATSGKPAVAHSEATVPAAKAAPTPAAPTPAAPAATEAAETVVPVPIMGESITTGKIYKRDFVVIIATTAITAIANHNHCYHVRYPCFLVNQDW